MNIVHLAPATVFLPSFIDQMNCEGFKENRHLFYLSDSIASGEISETECVKIFNKGRIKNFFLYLRLIFSINKSEKIFLHGLFDPRIILIVFFMPWILHKSYWIIWGADLYGYKYQNGWKNKLRYFFIGRIAKKIGHMVTYIKGDYENAVKWFGSKANYHECFMYKSNIYKEINIPEKFGTVTNVLVGNSADPMNNHKDIFSKLEKVKDKNIKIFVPLSYGDKMYANEVITLGREIFGNNIEFLTSLMQFNEYLDFLGKIDIVIFNHPYQQAMGNTITLLGLGKKVFMRSDVTQWALFKSHGITVYDIEELALSGSVNTQTEANKHIVKSYFSEKTFLKQLREIFN